jgi:acetylornithine deacetylase/succinyl-diaminopimelate desuccinylase-like protein
MKTVIPVQAFAKITCRLVADQKPERIAALISDYLRKIAPPAVKLDMQVQGGADPVTVPIDSPPVQALARAFRHHWAVPPLYRRTGGTLPIMSTFHDELKLPTVMLGFGLMDAGVHGPNEHYHVDVYRGWTR